MRDTLADVISQAGNLFPIIKVTGTPSLTTFEASDENKTLFFKASAAVAVPEFDGEFGLTNLGLLNGLLKFAPYDANANGKVSVERIKFGEDEVPGIIKFSDAKGKGATYRTMNAALVKGQAKIGNIPWDVVFNPDPVKLKEFSQLSSMLSEVDPNFGVRTDGSDLEFSIGGSNSSTHSGSMTFVENVAGEIKGEVQFNTKQFLEVMKMAAKATSATVSITGKGVLGVQCQTPHGIYDYYLRANRA